VFPLEGRRRLLGSGGVGGQTAVFLFPWTGPPYRNGNTNTPKPKTKNLGGWGRLVCGNPSKHPFAARLFVHNKTTYTPTPIKQTTPTPLGAGFRLVWSHPEGVGGVFDQKNKTLLVVGAGGGLKTNPQQTKTKKPLGCVVWVFWPWDGWRRGQPTLPKLNKHH